MQVRFGDCEFDSETHELTRAGRPMKLTPKAFELLGALLECRPRVLSKAQLHDRLWPATFVGRTSLARLVTEIRQAIGDDGRGDPLVRTVSGVGYAFSGEAVEAEARKGSRHSRWSLFRGGQEIPLSEGENLIGRDLGSAVQISGSGVSRRHARVAIDGERAHVEDLGSKNGTFLRGQKIAAATVLRAGDEIGVGPAVLVFSAASASASTTTIGRTKPQVAPATAGGSGLEVADRDRHRPKG